MEVKNHVCELCRQKFTRRYNLKNHIKIKHELVSMDYSCYLCKTNFKNQDIYLNHIAEHKEGLKFVLFKDVFDGALKVFRKYLKNYFTLTDILKEVDDLHSFFQPQLLDYPKYKVNINVQAEYILKGIDNIETEKELFNLRSSNFTISRINSNKSQKQIITDHLFEIIEKEKDLNLPQSGWTSNRLIFMDVALHQVNLLL